MRYSLTLCPACGGALSPTEYTCEACGTQVRGQFRACRFCRLDEEQMRFLELYLASRGNLSEAQRSLGISYPTALSRLDAVLNALGFGSRAEKAVAGSVADTRAVLESLAQGDIAVAQAIAMLTGREAEGEESTT